MQPENIEQILDRAFELVEKGDVDEAKSLFEQVIQQDGDNAEAWMMRGSINAETGNLDDAFSDLTRALQLDDSLPEAYYYLGTVHRARGDLREAVNCMEQAVALDPDYGEAFLLGGATYGMLGRFDQSEHFCRKAADLLPGSADASVNLGNVLTHKGNIEEACQHFAHAVQLQPDSLTAWTILGRTYARLGDFTKSAAAYQTVLKLKPDAEEAYYGLGFADYRLGRYEQSASNFNRALQINPGYTDAYNSLGTAYQAMGKYEDALASYEHALAIKPDYVEALFGKASVLIALSRQQDAIACLHQLLQIKPDYAEAYLNLASALMTFSKPGEALECCDKALQLQPDNIDAVALAAKIEQHAGQIEKAYQRLKPLVTSGVEHANIAIAYGEVCSSMNHPSEAITVLEHLLDKNQRLPATSRRNLHFGLGNLYNKIGDFDKAFANYKLGNVLRGVDWNPQVNRSQVDEIISVYSKAFFAEAPRAAVRSEKPLFVLGMPRSGTSLVEQILASHPSVFGAGELPDLMRMVHNLPAFFGGAHKYPDCVTALNQDLVDKLAQHYLSKLDELSPDALRIVDKMPGNYNYLGLIELLFPDAHVIHCVRDPLDTCLSCYFQDFARTQDYSYNLAHLGSFYKDYQRLMAHWKETLSIPILDVSYEELVRNQEAVSRQLVEFCGLDWDDHCLEFHQTERFVGTASYDQVRRPIYSSSMKRWEKYKKHLGPLIEILK